jgi:hypothetical protein
VNEPQATLPFPDLEALDVQRVSQSRRPKEARFWDRVIAFYAHVRDAVGADDYPRPSGVRVHPEDDERLRLWCAEPLRLRSRKSKLADTAWAWLDKGPSLDESVQPGTIVVLRERAYEDGGEGS